MASALAPASKVKVRMPTRLGNGGGRVSGEAIETCTRLDPPGYWARHVGRVSRVIWGDPLGTRVVASTSLQAAVRAGVGQGHGVCLAAGVSGGLKSHSVWGPGPISEGGGNASPARADGRYGEASEARRRRPGYEWADLEPPSTTLWRAGRPP